MSDYKINVFISSTSKDLIPYREKVKDAIIKRGMHPIGMEAFTATSRNAVQLCYNEVMDAHVLVCIYGLRYGYIPADLPEEMAHLRGKSITEMEYVWAEEQGIDRLVFLLDTKQLSEDSPVFLHADTIVPENASAVQKAQVGLNKALRDEFLNRIGQDIVWKVVTTEDNLAHEVSEALIKWQEQWQPPDDIERHSQREKLSIWQRMAIGGGALLGVLMLWNSLSLYNTGGLGFSGTGQSMTLWLLASVLIPIFLILLRPALPLSKKRFWQLWLILTLTLSVLLVVTPVLFQNTYVNLAQQALATGHIEQAKNALSMVNSNDETIINTLQNAVIEGQIPVDSLNTLVIEHLSAEQIDALADALVAEINTAIASDTDTTTRLQYLANALALLNRDRAVELASTLNDSATETTQRSQAQRMLYSAYEIDQFTQARPVAQRSATAYNLAVLAESDLSDADNIGTATQYYRQAIDIDPSNYPAYYALSSLLLITHRQAENPDQALNTAVNVANQGWEEVISETTPAACNRRSEMNLTDPEQFLDRWYCFILMTTESGALLTRADTNPGDLTRGRELAARAVALAQASDNFQQQSGYYPAEAYYYQAISSDETTTETLCSIIRYHNRDSGRQRGWADYANEQLGDNEC